ncbi:hypothetical protein B0H15DRAFT_804794 [Mycena belliarum]|uniref:Uncharacterized protein n=1 Tax=Mycena belliarum TaxID=1033014 RepID=A0AAD6TUC9_9AGAR|nr:hypothetical protein B0H15DRAFT_804794 [Mycena belliae]
MEAAGNAPRLAKAPQDTTLGPPVAPPRYRRHSARPLRSSPLAGPVRSSVDEGEDNKGEGSSQGAASAPSSRSPSLLSRREFASEDPTSRSRYQRESRAALRVVIPALHPSLAPKSASAPLASPPQRPARRRSNSQPLASFGVDDGSAGYGRKGAAIPGLGPRSSATPSPTLGSKENWLTATPYATTPHFSRLGLAAPGVVLPVRKGNVRTSSVDGGSAWSLGSIPSLTRTRSNSVSSSTQSVQLSSAPGTMASPRSYADGKVYDELGVGQEMVQEIVQEREEPHNAADNGLREDGRATRAVRGTIKRLWRKLRRAGS